MASLHAHHNGPKKLLFLLQKTKGSYTIRHLWFSHCTCNNDFLYKLLYIIQNDSPNIPQTNFHQLSDPPKYDHSDLKNLFLKSNIQIKPSKNPKRLPKIKKKDPQNLKIREISFRSIFISLLTHQNVTFLIPKTFPKNPKSKNYPPKSKEIPKNNLKKTWKISL